MANRRSFLKTAGLAALAAPSLLIARETERSVSSYGSDGGTPFKLKYAPSIGMFREHAGTDPVDHIKFANNNGFRAVFDNGFPGREKAEQERMVKELSRLNMDFGPYVLYADFTKTSFVLNSSEIREFLKDKMLEAVELAKRTGVKKALVVPGRFDERLHPDYQLANVVDNLRYCCDIVEEHDITLVLEPLNSLRDHPGLFLKGIPQSYSICRSVNRKSCKIVNDMYHQQITEGNIIPNIDASWNEIAAFHIGDNPGRKEPTTGEINYKNIFKHIHNKGFDGVLCMEHGKSISGKEGEKRVIEAYREVDNF